MRKISLPLAAIFFWTVSFAQAPFNRVDTVRVIVAGDTLKNPWVGGHNFCMFSPFDFDGDGTKDLFVFDKTGNKVTCYINEGMSSTVSYKHAPQYEKMFPALERFCLIRDFNCDGKEDLFTYNGSIAGIKVYKNVTTTPGNLQFQLFKALLMTQYPATTTNLYVSGIDIPAIRDLDNDGDLDVLSFNVGGSKIEYHINMSQENGWGCDSLKMVVDKDCWGYFSEGPAASCPTLNQPACNTILKSYNPDEELNLDGAHTIEAFDEDNDGDKEAIVGLAFYPTMYKIHNNGTPDSAYMDTADCNWPSNTLSVNMNLMGLANNLDVNNDGARDMLVGPVAPSISKNWASIWYYKNTNTDQNPVFVFQQNDLLQDEAIEVGEGAYPVFFDYDADGLLDIIVANYGYYISSAIEESKFALFRNTGTISQPEFTMITTDYANMTTLLAGTRNIHPTFGDLDNDNDSDMMVGEYNGFIHYFENTAGAGNPASFVLADYQVQDVTATNIDVGQFSAPQLIDLNRDGKLDLIIGEGSGNLNYYENTGTVTAAQWTKISDTLGAIDVSGPFITGYSIPFMYDDSGSYELLVGSESGYIWHFNNIDGNILGTYNLLDSTFEDIYEGIRSSPYMADITNDGLYDLLVGNYRGGISFYIGDMTVGITEASQLLPDFNIFPNPSCDVLNVKIDKELLGVKNLRLEIYNMLGQQVSVNIISELQTAVNVSSLANGVYTCKLTNGKISRMKKLVIEK